jgi:ATP-dependent protease ClpP protease subunit
MKQHKLSMPTGSILALPNGQDTAPRVFTNAISHMHEFYITGEIEDPEYYIDWFHTIRHANPNDIVVLYINSPGGDGSTAIQFKAVIEDCPALVMASIEGDCMSAATMIALTCDQMIIADHSRFMIHNYSAMSMGKGNEMFDHITAERLWSENLMRDIYSGFLTDAEISQVLEGKDIWLNKEEVTKRLERRIKLQKKNQKKPKPKKEKVLEDAEQ